MTEWVEQRICIKFCVKLEHSSTENSHMIQKAATMGNWWLAASPWQCACSCITSRAVFWWNIKSLRWLSPLYSPYMVPWDFWLFPKLESPLKGKRFQTTNEIQENTSWKLIRLGKQCDVLRCLLWRGLRRHCPLYNVSCMFFNKCLSFFIFHGWIPNGQTYIFTYRVSVKLEWDGS